MEESLDNLININKSLICKKDEIRKKLFEKFNYCKCAEKLEKEESNFFRRASLIFNDEEFEKLRKEHERLCYLTCSIRCFINEY